MAKKHDSTALFLAQVQNHYEELSGLLAIQPLQPIDSEKAARSILTTSMLSNSASLLELNGWNECLAAFEKLVATYRDRGLSWDERIAQMTSEILEREEELINNAPGVSGAKLAAVAGDADLAPVVAELAALQTEATTMAPAPQPTPQPVAAQAVPQPVAAQAAPQPVAPQAAPQPVAAQAVPQPVAAQAAPQPVANFDATVQPEVLAPTAAKAEQPLGRSIDDLRQCAQQLLSRWTASDWELGPDTADDFNDVRRDLYLMNFYAQSVEQIIGIKTGNRSVVTMDSLFPIRSALEDFTGVLCAGGERRIDINFRGEEHTIDARLLFPVVNIIQNMIGDIFERCDDEYLHIEVIVEEQFGHLTWSLRDNGNNFMADSQLDPDEHFAFYPSLKNTSRVLLAMQCVLSVEPEGNRDTRFQFTIPMSPEGGRFLTWGSGKERFAVHSHQVCELRSPADAAVSNDARGEYVMAGGNRVPVVRLSQLYQSAPDGGDRVVVIGSLEKRIALFVPDEGKLEDGEWLKAAVPAWRGMHQGMASIVGVKVPLVDAGGLSNHYMSIINTAAGDVSGGVGAEEEHLSQSQAPPVGEDTPPETSSADHQVMVLERSEPVRHELKEILEQQKFTTRTFDELEDALEALGHQTPSLIISEFRVPSMAAKILVEKLRIEGRNIPVLVTTGHTGENAALLVKKLGAAGFISKPLDPSLVLTTVGELFQTKLTTSLAP